MAQNPLEIDLVLANISRYFNVHDLKACRSINRQWCRVLDKAFLKQCGLLKVLPCEPPENVNHQRNQPVVISIATLMELTGNSQSTDPLSTLFRRYENFHLCDTNYIPMLPQLYTFLDEFGDKIRKLRVDSIDLLENFEDFIAIISCKYTPSLRVLQVCLRKVILGSVPLTASLSEKLAITASANKFMQEFQIHTETPNNSITALAGNIPWQHVLSLYPNLKILAIIGWAPAVFKDIATAIKMINTSDNKSNLRELHLTGGKESSWRTTETGIAHCQDVLKTLVSAKLKLNVIRMDDSAGSFCIKFVENQCETIKTLSIETEMNNENFQLMPCLEQLSVTESSNLTFLDKAPKLLMLSFGRPSNTSIPIVWPNIRHVLPIWSLTSFKSSSTWCSSDVQQLFPWMPNITDLEMNLNDETFPMVCKHLVKVKRLSVLGGNLHDKGVVGNEDQEADDVTFCSIIKLKDLEMFKMQLRRHHPGLTEQSVVNGFLKLEKLSELTLLMKFELIPEVMDSLLSKVASVNIRVKRERRSSIEPPF